jgi:hypothetical protein
LNKPLLANRIIGVGFEAAERSMTQWSSPPPAARWLLERALPSDLRESVTGDLDEVFQRVLSNVRAEVRATSFFGGSRSRSRCISSWSDGATGAGEA